MNAGRTIPLLPVLAIVLATSTAAAQDTRVVFERTGYRLTALGAQTTVNARVLNGNGRPVANAPMRYRVDEPGVATVTDRGVVQSRRVGRTRLWAVSGADSASALLIVDQWAASFAFNPAVVRLDAVGQRSPLQVQARDASGNPVAGLSGNCRVKDETIAQLAGGQVAARANGVTYVRCTDRGIADSVRVEVRQRPARIAIVDKNNLPVYTVGDNFQLRLQAFDAEGGAIPDPRPTWASLDPRAVNIDPLSGSGRAVGATDAPVRVVAQYGDVTDTVAITVRPGAGLGLVSLAGPAADPPAPNLVEAPRTAALRLEVLNPVVGDTMSVTITARDSTGTAADPAQVRVRSSDTSIVSYIGRQRIVAKKEGSAWLVGSFGSLRDSTIVTVRPVGSATIAAGEPSRPFVRPVYEDAAAARARNQRQLQDERARILAASPLRTQLNRMISFTGSAGQVVHSTRAIVLEERTGLMFGGTLALQPWRWLNATAEGQFGSLSPSGTTSEDMEVRDATGRLNFRLWDWLTLHGGFTVRSQTTPTAAQEWQFASVGTLLRFRFVGGAFSTTIGGSIMPRASYSGHRDASGNEVAPNPTSFSGEAGVEWSARWINAGLHYYAERFTFPVINGMERVDQFSMLRLKLGFQVGR